MSLKQPPMNSPSASSHATSEFASIPDLTDQGAVDYIFENWCQFTDKDHPARLAFQQNKINNMISWITLTDDAINTMTVRLEKLKGKRVDEILLPPVVKVRIRHVIMFGLDLLEQYQGHPPNNAWRDEVSIASFFKYLADWTIKNRKSITDGNPISMPTPLKLQNSPVVDFKKSTKRDKTNYIEFKDE